MHESTESAGAAHPVSDGVPAFYLAGSDAPRKGALVNGGLLAIAVFGFVAFLIGHGGRPRLFLIGSHHPSHSHLLPARTDALPSTDLETEIKMSPDAAISGQDPVRSFVAGYFRRILVLAALDVDHDHVLSPEEIADAPMFLASLDLDHDGRLTAEECGLHIDPRLTAPSRYLERERRSFMRLHPVLAALDVNHDGEISREEIQGAAARLKTLDRNYDGRLTASEILPDPVAYHAALLLSLLDRDGEGTITAAKASKELDGHFTQFLKRADLNRDGLVSEEELRAEIRRRADADRDGVVTWEEALMAIRQPKLW